MGCCSSRQVQEEVDMAHTASQPQPTYQQTYQEPAGARIQPHDPIPAAATPAVPEYSAHPPVIITRDEKSTSSPPPFGSTSGVALLSSPIQDDKPQLDEKSTETPVGETTTDETPIIVRLSIARDVKIRIPSSSPYITVSQLRTRLYDHHDLNISSSTHTIRFIYLGKVLKDTTTIQPIQPDTQCKNSADAVFVNDGGIVQALLSRSS
ncbi:hypothetical protein INT44_000461 [Umbelopsis vinacea]|uniref:DSC E3 ubiquitin ligase complex subunit 3 ubiquitin-like domain-containing protein n=1 Tax=Umbelopsis vinacea TaxID=44442 RepID=A0A8H7PL41_9FUNG|nr:hypothetical protein INT44_000461 [Umbelopsis vinacea]KAI9284744.1 hypothetical protein BC943DRAFT_338024 [Umbelopsis sp. AD052]